MGMNPLKHFVQISNSSCDLPLFVHCVLKLYLPKCGECNTFSKTGLQKRKLRVKLFKLMYFT